MKFMTMVTVSNPEKAGPPPPALFGAIAELGIQAGKALEDSGGMAEIGVVKIDHGELIVDGPYAEAKEIAGFGLYEVETKEEVIEWTKKFLELHRKHWPAWEGEVVVRQIIHFDG